MFKLGRKSFIKDERDLKLSNYTESLKLHIPPVSFGHYSLINKWEMLANDTVGDCTISGAEHETMLWTDEGKGKSAIFTDQNALSDYSAITGYTSNDPSTDTGADVRTVLKYRQQTGFG